MVSESEFKRLSKRIFSLSKARDVEVLFFSKEEDLSRFANNTITQDISSKNIEVAIRVLLGKKHGKAVCNQLDDASLEAAVRAAEESAKVQRKDPTILPLQKAQRYRALNNYVERTVQLLPGEKVERIKRSIEKVAIKGATAAGIFSTDAGSVGISNSGGLFAYNSTTTATYSITVMAEDGSGWASDTDKDINAIDINGLTETALNKALSSRGPKEIEPGEYTVILEPAAVAELLLFMSFHGFGAMAYIEKRSFLSGKIGEKVFDERITIIDDAYHPQTIGINFDFEGTARQKVILIEKGVARGIVHDRKTAKALRAKSTGHSLPQPSAHGPIALNIVLSRGDSSLAEMIETTEKGIFVTHLHYTNLIDPMKLILTGMTRDGTFFIEKGRVKYPIKNLRFTESVIRAFNNIEALSEETKYTSAFFGGGFVVPAIKIKKFNFSSATSF